MEIKQTLKEFFRLLDMKEESESGKVFSPIQITSYRAMLTPKLSKLLEDMRVFANDQ